MPRGIIGSGITTSRIFSDGHWDNDQAGGTTNYVLIDWDTLLLPEDGPALRGGGRPHPPEGGIWRPRASGWVLPPTAAVKLEALWAEHLGLATPPATTRHAPMVDHSLQFDSGLGVRLPARDHV